MRKTILFILMLLLCVNAHAEIQTLKAYVNISHTGDEWAYTVVNDEAKNSSYYATSFSLDFHTPIKVTGTPAGWTYTTDGFSFVLWQNNDASLPYSHDIAPGQSMTGFKIEVLDPYIKKPALYQIDSWDHVKDVAGIVSKPLWTTGPFKVSQ